MLDTRGKLAIADGTDAFDHRISVRLAPSFGLGSLKSRKRLLGLSTAIFLAIGLLYALHRPTTYTASSQLLVYIKQILTGADLAILPGRADLPLVQNQIELLRSGNVLVKVVADLQLDKDIEFFSDHSLAARVQAKFWPDEHVRSGGAAFSAALDTLRRNLSIRQVGTSHMVLVKFTASAPEKAAQVVNKLIRIYLQELSRASDAGSSKAPALRELYQSLGPSAYLVSESEPPIRANGPPAALIAIGAALFGLGAAAAIALLLDAINDTIRSVRQMESTLGLECLGVICARSEPSDITGIFGEVRYAPDGQALRRAAATMLEASQHGLRAIGVTSSLPGEGVTTLAIGLAQTVAASGKQVLLVDGCPEDPSVSRWAAGAPCAPAWLRGDPRSKALDSLVEVQKGLHVLPLAELIDCAPCSTRVTSLDEILRNTAGIYDFVVVDLPALIAGPDVRAAARSLDGFLLVVKWGATESELVRQAFRSAGEAQPKFVGAVLNMANEKTMKRYGHEILPDLKVATAS